MRKRKLCNTCGKQCDKDFASHRLLIRCTYCDGQGCTECRNGDFLLEECPKSFVGHEMNRAINLCAMADKGFLPVHGGMLDQSEWFSQIYHVITNELNEIEAAEAEQLRNKTKR